MDSNLATELSYKNGYAAGKLNTEITMRLKLAYEQLSFCHADICKNTQQRDNLDYLLNDLREAMGTLLALRTRFGDIVEG